MSNDTSIKIRLAASAQAELNGASRPEYKNRAAILRRLMTVFPDAPVSIVTALLATGARASALPDHRANDEHFLLRVNSGLLERFDHASKEVFSNRQQVFSLFITVLLTKKAEALKVLEAE